jgi:transcriptional regulator with XRE-family HTH domain
MARNPDPSTYRRRLRLALRTARDNASMTQRAAADALEWSLSKIIRIEGGTVGISITDLRALLDLYGVTDTTRRASLLEDSRRGKEPSWWHPYQEFISPAFAQLLGYEADASEILLYHPTVVPGMLQTDEYATALLTGRKSDEAVAALVALRVERHERLFPADDENGGPPVSVLLDEGAVRRVVGGPRTLRNQLKRLRALALHPRITLQIVAFEAGAYATLDRSSVMLDLKGKEVLFFEGPTGDLVSREDEQVRHRETFEQARAAALSEEDSLALLDEIIARYPDPRTEGGADAPPHSPIRP